MKKKILIIGGGASGLMAAITAAGNNAEVTICEKNDRVGKKILATGNGKCNISNRNLTIDNYFTENPDRLKSYFNVFDVEDTIFFFKECGLLLKDKNGYLYPACEQASTVLDILRNQIKQLHVTVLNTIEILESDLYYNESGTWNIRINGKTFVYDAVILACGSYAGLIKGEKFSGYAIAKKMGHTVLPPFPALVQLICKEKFFPSISGVRCDALLTLKSGREVLTTERGELQITDYGISGIPVFQFSRIVAVRLSKEEKVSVNIDFLPDYDRDEWKLFIKNRLITYQGEEVETFFTGLLHKKLNVLFIKLYSLKVQELVNEDNYDKIINACMAMKDFTVTPIATKPFENAQTTAGGVILSQLDNNLQSVIHPNLYFCGEIIDVDGKCGGYNLQWAWTSGYIAGNSASKQDN